MKKSLPPLTWFRAFDAAARHLSFTAAGDDIGLTQSAVSQQVKALETRLGTALFSRHARGLSLTDAGRRLVPQVGAALGELAAATEMFDAGPAENLLTIASSVSVAQWVISPGLTRFTSAHPSIRIRFLSTIWPDDFNSARADVEIRFGSGKQVGRNADRLTPDRLVPLRSPTLQGDLRDLPLIETVGTSSGWTQWAAEIGPVADPRIYADSYGMALHFAAQGHGVALVSELLATDAERRGILERAHPGSIAGNEGYYLAIDKKNPVAATFCDWLLAQGPQIPDAPPELI